LLELAGAPLIVTLVILRVVAVYGAYVKELDSSNDKVSLVTVPFSVIPV
jgi:hypothetical protein